MRTPRLLAGLAAFLFAFHGPTARAESPSFPTKPIRIIVPFTPGGSPDLLARTVGMKLQAMWGQPIVVENVPGAGGSIGAQAAARAPADGYTWLVAPNSVLVFAPLLQRQHYDPIKSFAPVGLAITVENLLVVHPSLPVKNMAELIAFAKAKPGELTYASGGPGSPQNFSVELLKSMAGLDMMHIPYKGTLAALPDVLNGSVPVFLSQANALLPHVEAGKLRLLAGTGARRYPALPNVPAIAETVPGYSVDIWSGFVMPANTPEPIIQKANAALLRVLAMPDVQAVFAKQGIDVAPSSPRQMAATIQSDLARWGKVVKEAQIKAE
jgi:tripartite-type tricarboxylate transporter receptor subunit TctC